MYRSLILGFHFFDFRFFIKTIIPPLVEFPTATVVPSYEAILRDALTSVGHSSGALSAFVVFRVEVVEHDPEKDRMSH